MSITPPGPGRHLPWTKIRKKGFPARYWHRLDDGRLQCDLCPRSVQAPEKASAACVSCVPATASHPRANHHGRSGRASASIPSRRSRSTTSSRHAGPVVRHGRLQPDLPVLPELGHLQGARVRPLPTRRRPRRSPRRPNGRAAGRLLSLTTIPSFSWNTRSTSPPPAGTGGVKTVAVTAGYVCEEPRTRVLPPTWTPPTLTSRASRRASTRSYARLRWPRCSRR